jgi:hypothetical protein
MKITPLPMDDHLGHGERSVKRGGILGKQATAQKGQGCMLCARCPGNAAGRLKQRFIDGAPAKGAAQKVANHAGTAEQAKPPSTQRAAVEPSEHPIAASMRHGRSCRNGLLGAPQGPAIQTRGRNPNHSRGRGRAPEHGSGGKFSAKGQGAKHGSLAEALRAEALGGANRGDEIFDAIGVLGAACLAKAREFQQHHRALGRQTLG